MVTQKNAFSGFCQNFPRPWIKLKIFLGQFPNPWALWMSGMGCYTSKCEKKSKSLHPNAQHSFFVLRGCTVDRI